LKSLLFYLTQTEDRKREKGSIITLRLDKKGSFYVISLTIFATVMRLRQIYDHNLSLRFSMENSIYL